MLRQTMPPQTLAKDPPALAADATRLLITGSMGAGKTTVIRAITGIAPVQTDVPITDGSGRDDKTTTTVAMDYGAFTLPDGRRLMLFGTPGQRRFDFMCRVLARGCVGTMILIDHCAADPLGDLAYYLDLYSDTIAAAHAVVCVTRTDLSPAPGLEPYRAFLADRGMQLPVLKLDARERQSIFMAMMALLISIR